MVEIDQTYGDQSLGADATMQASEVLHKWLLRVCPEMHRARRDALSAVVLAGVSGRRLTVTDLGRSIESDAKEKHCIKRADRLLSNRHLQHESAGVYAAIARQLIGAQRRPVISVDWSDLDPSKRHFLLRAAIAVQGRSLTLYEEVHPLQGKDKPGVQQAFLKRLRAALPTHCRPIIVTDAGFRTPWFKQVQSLGWDWIGRVRNRHWVALNGDEWWVPCKSLYDEARATPKSLGEAKLTWRHAHPCRLVVYKAPHRGRSRLTRYGRRSRQINSLRKSAAQLEPWLLATSLPLDTKLAKAEADIEAARTSAMAEIEDVALEATQDIVSRLAGTKTGRRCLPRQPLPIRRRPCRCDQVRYYEASSAIYICTEHFLSPV